MGCPNSPELWDQWFRAGRIHEPEFFHGLICCAKTVPIERALVVLSEDERSRFRDQVAQLVAIDNLLPGQFVTSVVRFALADAKAVLAQLEGLSVPPGAPSAIQASRSA